MKYLYTIPFIIFFACSTSEKDQSRREVFQAINKEVLANSKAYTTLKESTETTGHRLTGSKNGAEAEEFTYNLLKSYGYNDVKYDEFEVEAWSRGTVSLSVNDSVYTDVVTLGQAPVKADVTNEMVDVGNGLREDFERLKDEVKGKIVLAYIGLLPDQKEGKKNIHRSEKTALAIEFGATGIIIINQVPNRVLLTGTASVTGTLIPIPAVCISYEDGLIFKERLANGEKLTAHIEMTNNSDVIKARNVVATLKGTEFPDEEILLGGHLDSWDLATGAIDNGIGSFAILDIARTFKALDLKTKRTIKFVMFMGEEQGLLGSRAMVKRRVEDGSIDKVKYMMNIDMSGNPKGFNAGGREETVALLKEIGEDIKAVDSTFQNANSNRAGLHSDHQTFLEEGIPIVGVVGNLEPKVYSFYHSNGDDFNLVNEEHLENTVRFSTMLFYGLANAEKLPATKLNFEETKQFMIDNNLKDELVLGNKWRWGE